MPQPALPEVPGAQTRSLDGGPREGTVPGPVLPPGIHTAGGTEQNWPCTVQNWCTDCSLKLPGRLFVILPVTPNLLEGHRGMVAILHTWGQNLGLHPHLHCIVPGGGISTSGKWKAAHGKGKFLFPVKAMGQVFRAKYAQALRKEGILGNGLYKDLFARPWVVYCKQPFFGPAQVVEYLGRYTHKIAISNHRIRNIENGQVVFSAKDYRKGGSKYLLSLSEEEFVRRFALHILPRGFTRIRHYGILSSTLKKVCVELLQKELGRIKLPERKDVHLLCPVCRKGKLVTIWRFNSRGPPPVGSAILNFMKKLVTMP